MHLVSRDLITIPAFQESGVFVQPNNLVPRWVPGEQTMLQIFFAWGGMENTMTTRQAGLLWKRLIVTSNFIYA